MLDIKLLAVDLDGTLLNNDSKVTSRTRSVVTKAVEQGIIFVVASGRMRYRIPDDVLSIPGFRYLVSANGACVMDLQTDTVIYEDPLPTDISLSIFNEIAKYPIYLELYCGGYAITDQQRFSYYFPSMHSPGRREIMGRGIHIVDNLLSFILDKQHLIDKINLPFIAPEFSEIVTEILGKFQINSTQSLPQNAEINHFSANKGAGLRVLCNKLDILPNQVLAFGDANNDLDMLQFADHSVAMSNASTDAKAYARYVTKSNDADGVAVFLEEYILR